MFVFSAGKLITLEAMSGLSKVLLHLDKKNVHLLVVYIFMKIKPFLESVSFISSMLYNISYCKTQNYQIRKCIVYNRIPLHL